MSKDNLGFVSSLWLFLKSRRKQIYKILYQSAAALYCLYLIYNEIWLCRVWSLCIYICVLGSCLKVKELSVVSAGSEAEAESVITNRCTATIQRANQCQMVK